MSATENLMDSQEEIGGGVDDELKLMSIIRDSVEMNR